MTGREKPKEKKKPAQPARQASKRRGKSAGRAQADVKAVALRLAKWHAEAEPHITEILLFPDEKAEEVRLIEIDPTAMPKENRIAPFYFAPEPPEVPMWLALALILPEEKGRLQLPEGWGPWDNGETIWVRNEKNAA